MRDARRHGVVLGAALLAGGLALSSAFPAAADDGSTGIGRVAVVQREASVIHPVKPRDVILVALGDAVLFRDIYETREAARLKLLFDDDSLLSLGEKTRLQITEDIYDPGRDFRSTSISLTDGWLRALVGRHFGAAGSKFEVHTRSAVAAARGTYFVVRVTGCPEERAGEEEACSQAVTEVLNIGRTGRVAVGPADPAVGGALDLDPGAFTRVFPNAPPSPAVPASLAQVVQFLAETEISDAAVDEVPSGTDVPGAAEALEEASVRSAARSDGGGEGVPTVPPILQESLPQQAGVSVELQF